MSPQFFTKFSSLSNALPLLIVFNANSIASVKSSAIFDTINPPAALRAVTSIFVLFAEPFRTVTNEFIASSF